MFKKMKSIRNRTETNHPVRTWIGKYAATSGTATAAGFVMLPIDGGVTLFLTSIGSLAGGVVGTIFTLIDLESREDRTTLTHGGEDYSVTEAQKQKYNQLQTKIDSLTEQFKAAKTERTRKKIKRKAQNLADYQDDILDSKNVNLIEKMEANPELKISYKHRQPKN